MLPLPTPESPREEGISWILGSAFGSPQSERAKLFLSLLPGARPADAEHPFPASLLSVALAAPWQDETTLEDIVPVYLRDPDAIDNLDAISRTQGRDPARARTELQRLLTRGI